MSATKSSVSGTGVSTLLKLSQVVQLILQGKRDDGVVQEIGTACQAVIDNTPFQVVITKPASLGQFLAMPNPTQAMFNQLASEVSWSWWDLLDQIEESCFLLAPAIEKAQPFLKELWKDEVNQNSYKPPAGWKYIPVEEAVEAYRKLFGSSLKANSVLKLAREARPRQESEGVAIWPKLSTLAKLFGVSGNPLENTEKGWEAYARIVELFIPEVGKAYTKAYPNFSFRNWREGQLTTDYLRLTPAGRKVWQRLERESEDDFVIASYGAATGSVYSGYSVRRSRIEIVLAGDQFPQECVMVGGTIATQPDRLTKFEHLYIDCPGTKYVTGAGGRFSYSLCFYWGDGGLRFDGGWAGVAVLGFGSASGFLG